MRGTCKEVSNREKFSNTMIDDLGPEHRDKRPRIKSSDDRPNANQSDKDAHDLVNSDLFVEDSVGESFKEEESSQGRMRTSISRPPNAYEILPICKFFLAGNCAYGSSCRYKHANNMEATVSHTSNASPDNRHQIQNGVSSEAIQTERHSKSQICR